MSVSEHAILYPSFAMFGLVAFVLVKLARLRFAAVGDGTMNAAFYKTYQLGEEPEHIRVVTRHFLNLFEVPILFHVIVVMTYATRHGGAWMVALAWLYVAIRFVHTYVHLSSNDVRMRFQLFLASCLVLGVMWGSLFVALVTGA
jgi:hypothetical protein